MLIGEMCLNGVALGAGTSFHGRPLSFHSCCVMPGARPPAPQGRTREREGQEGAGGLPINYVTEVELLLSRSKASASASCSSLSAGSPYPSAAVAGNWGNK